MTTIHLSQTTTATPEQSSPGSPTSGRGAQLFGNSADDYLKVHDQGPGQADVTEGRGASGNAWTTTGPTPTASS